MRWVSWCSKRNGNDCRRPSGVGWTRTKYMHAVPEEGARSLCNRDVGSLVSEKDRDLPRCPVCAKRAGKEAEGVTATKLFDVVAVNLKTKAQRIIATGRDALNAEAVVAMAVARHGCETEFFRAVPAKEAGK